MNPRIVEKIQLVREGLSKEPLRRRLAIAELPDGREAMHPEGNWIKYYELAKVCNGARFGNILFWNLEELEGNQFPSESIPGGRIRWLVVGKLEDDSLVLEAGTGMLWRFPWDAHSSPRRGFSDFDWFVENTALGPGYADAVFNGHEDDWFLFLKAHGLA